MPAFRLDRFGFGMHLGDDPFCVRDQFRGRHVHFVMHQVGNFVLALDNLFKGLDVGLELRAQAAAAGAMYLSTERRLKGDLGECDVMKCVVSNRINSWHDRRRVKCETQTIDLLDGIQSKLSSKKRNFLISTK